MDTVADVLRQEIEHVWGRRQAALAADAGHSLELGSSLRCR